MTDTTQGTHEPANLPQPVDFTEFEAEWGAKLRSFAARQLRMHGVPPSRLDAKDVAQATLAYLYSRRDEIIAPSHYMWIQAKGLISQAIEDIEREAASLQSVPAPEIVTSAEESVIARETVAEYDALLAETLTPSQRIVFIALFFHKMSYKEVAEQHGIKVNSIPQIRRQAIKKLKNIDRLKKRVLVLLPLAPFLVGLRSRVTRQLRLAAQTISAHRSTKPPRSPGRSATRPDRRGGRLTVLLRNAGVVLLVVAALAVLLFGSCSPALHTSQRTSSMPRITPSSPHRPARSGHRPKIRTPRPAKTGIGSSGARTSRMSHPVLVTVRGVRRLGRNTGLNRSSMATRCRQGSALIAPGCGSVLPPRCASTASLIVAPVRGKNFNQTSNIYVGYPFTMKASGFRPGDLILFGWNSTTKTWQAHADGTGNASVTISGSDGPDSGTYTAQANSDTARCNATAQFVVNPAIG